MSRRPYRQSPANSAAIGELLEPKAHHVDFVGMNCAGD
jgi:hypothetical protein